MRDYTLVCESTNRTIVFSQAALVTGGLTEAKGSGISLSGEPKCWVERSCPPLQKPLDYQLKQHGLQSVRERDNTDKLQFVRTQGNQSFSALMLFSTVPFQWSLQRHPGYCDIHPSVMDN